MKVMLKKDLWIAGGSTFTHNESEAKEFESMDEAQKALEFARSHELFPDAAIEEDMFS